MRVGISQLVVPGDWPLAKFFQEARAAGYEAVEIACRDAGEFTPDTTDAQIREIVRQAAAAGVELNSMVHSHSRQRGNLLASGEPQQFAIERTKAALDRAAAAGIRGSLHTLGSVTAELYYDEAYRNAVQSLKALAPTAEKLGVAIAVEFVWNGFLFSPLEMKQLLDAVGSPQIGFYFDPGNMAVFQYPQHWARILGPHIKRVHMKDWKGRALNGGWHALLQGGTDFKAVMAELRRAGYDDALISEVDMGLAPLARTAETIRQIMAM